MVRPLGFLVGLGFITALVLAIFTTPLSNEPNVAYSFVKHPRHVKLASDGLVPHWDKAQLQRGMQVYKEVCSACHSLNLVAFRNIQDLGYTEGQVKTFAKGFQVPSINPDTGEVAGPPRPAARSPANSLAGKWAGPRSSVATIAACASRIDRLTRQQRVGLGHFGHQRRIIRNVAVPFNEHRLRPGAAQKGREQIPATVAHR